MKVVTTSVGNIWQSTISRILSLENQINNKKCLKTSKKYSLVKLPPLLRRTNLMKFGLLFNSTQKTKWMALNP